MVFPRLEFLPIRFVPKYSPRKWLALLSLTERRVIIIRMIVTTTAIVMTRAINRNMEDYRH